MIDYVKYLTIIFILLLKISQTTQHNTSDIINEEDHFRYSNLSIKKKNNNDYFITRVFGFFSFIVFSFLIIFSRKSF